MIIIQLAQLDQGDVELDGIETPVDINIQGSDLLEFKDDVVYHLKAQLVTGGILLTGEVGTKFHGSCGRCTAKFEQDIVNREVCHFYEDVGEQQLDVTDDVSEDLQIVLPMNPLCSERCSGLCNQCGIDLNKASCDCVAEDIADDIWGDLDKLDFGD
jgi:DUF177 domain-containing protein